MKDFAALNAVQMKSLYMVENELDAEEINVIKELIDSFEYNEEAENPYDANVELIEELAFLSYKNLGIFTMLHLATEITGSIEDKFEIKSFIDIFLSFYKNLQQKISIEIEKGEI